MTMWHKGFAPRWTVLAGVLIAGFTTAAPAQDSQLTIAFRANQEPASLDGQIDPYQSTWLFNSFVADPLRDPRPRRASTSRRSRTSWEVDAGRQGLDLQAARRRDVPGRHAVRRRGGEVQPRAHRRSEDRLGAAQERHRPGQVGRGRRSAHRPHHLRHAVGDAARRAAAHADLVADGGREARPARTSSATSSAPVRSLFGEWVQNDRIVFTRWDGYGGWNPMSDEARARRSSIRSRSASSARARCSATSSRRGDADVAFKLPAAVDRRLQGRQELHSSSRKDQSGTGLQHGDEHPQAAARATSGAPGAPLRRATRRRSTTFSTTATTPSRTGRSTTSIPASGAGASDDVPARPRQGEAAARRGRLEAGGRQADPRGVRASPASPTARR